MYLFRIVTPTTAPFPYTTLFRSHAEPAQRVIDAHHALPGKVDRVCHTGLRPPVRRQRRPLEAPHLPRDPHPRRGNLEVLERSESTRLNSSHANISYAVFCLKKKN